MMILREQVLLMIDKIIDDVKAEKDTTLEHSDLIHSCGKIIALLQLKTQLMLLKD